jgi:hypothetical protein
VGRALEACHAARLIHRDVAPSSIVVTKAGLAKLDNLVLATDMAGGGGVEFAGRIARTMGYMSPEQTLGENLAPQSDIFSLGIVAWELLCGKSVYGRGSAEQVAERVQTDVPPRASDVNPMVEPVFGEIVERMLDRDRSRRYDTVSEVLSDLKAAIRTHGYEMERKTLARFVEDPNAYVEWYTRCAVEKLRATVAGAGSDPIALMRQLEKLAHLEPDDEDVRRELARLKHLAERAEKTGTSPKLVYSDPTMTYRVVLESLDTSRESPASFAVKLATKLRVPLPMVRSYVENMPVALPGEHPHRKAVFIAGVMEELGAVARVEVCHKQAMEPQVCPECESQVDPDAEFCSFCQHRFVAFVELRPGLDDDDTEALCDAGEFANHISLLARFQGLPTQTKVLIGSLVVLAIVLWIAT